ncbi:MAG TPA: hypothetical protein VNQ73_07265 [Ilumatobacter sp.]|nr:hypothetical protein [Ilumatobacter sp.]
MIVAAHPAPILATRAAIDLHVAAELTSDPVTIVGTVGNEPFFPALVRDGSGAAALELLTSTEAVSAFYRARVGTFEIVDTTRVTELRTDWYALHESIATVRHVGDYHGVAPDGATHRVHSAVLFPVAAEGIVGELEWTHVDFTRIFSGTARAEPDGDTFIPTGRLHAAELHDEVLARWFAGDAAGVADLTGPIPWASRHAHPGSALPPLCAATAGEGLATAAATFADVTLSESPERLQRMAASWYSFVEATLDVADATGPRTIRVASLLALEAGRPSGHLAYSVDVVDDAAATRPTPTNP